MLCADTKTADKLHPITIVLVDDHALVRQTWAFVINSDRRFRVVGECGSGEDSLTMVKELQPNVVIMDINLPGISGIEATEQIVQAGHPCRVIGVSLHSDPNYARKIMEKGARGYVTKNSAREEMFEAITRIHNGEMYICKEMQAVLKGKDGNENQP